MKQENPRKDLHKSAFQFCGWHSLQAGSLFLCPCFEPQMCGVNIKKENVKRELCGESVIKLTFVMIYVKLSCDISPKLSVVSKPRNLLWEFSQKHTFFIASADTHFTSSNIVLVSALYQTTIFQRDNSFLICHFASKKRKLDLRWKIFTQNLCKHEALRKLLEISKVNVQIKA